MIKLAQIEDVKVIQNIVHNTISEIYPNYYPKEVVDFFLEHHREENIMKDIQIGNVYLLYRNDECVGTGTIDGEYMNRVFILPSHQGKGYGTLIMNFIEDKIAKNYNKVYIDSSLPAFNIYIKRGYNPIKYSEEFVGNNRVLCFQVMSKEVNSINFNLNNRLFVSVSNTENGDVTSETSFRYYQEKSTVWAQYSGGEVEKGHIIGKFKKDNHIYFSYQHIHKNGDIRIGECDSIIEILSDGRLRMRESWKWLKGDKSHGESIIEEKRM